jgi:hypothetical protein
MAWMKPMLPLAPGIVKYSAGPLPFTPDTGCISPKTLSILLLTSPQEIKELSANIHEYIIMKQRLFC